MATTYEKIATTTLGSANSTITFSSIAATYTDLRIVFVPVQSAAIGNWYCQFNGDTATNYSYARLSGDGANAASFRATSSANIFLSQGVASGSIFLTTIDIFSYAGSTNKTALTTLSGDKNGSGNTNAIVGLWRNTAAITSITITDGGTVGFSAGTTATLYGILKA